MQMKDDKEGRFYTCTAHILSSNTDHPLPFSMLLADQVTCMTALITIPLTLLSFLILSSLISSSCLLILIFHPLFSTIASNNGYINFVLYHENAEKGMERCLVCGVLNMFGPHPL